LKAPPVQTYGSREHTEFTDTHCSIDVRKYDYLEIIGVEIFALNMNSRIECHREDRENMKRANISTHTVTYVHARAEVHDHRKDFMIKVTCTVLESNPIYSPTF
jgi:hypothetical protein